MSVVYGPVKYKGIILYGYRVGTDGSVWSRRMQGCGTRLNDNWRKLRPIERASGHVVFFIQFEGKQYNLSIHRTVLEAFVGPCPEGMECRHLDGNPKNNLLSNLCWGTKSENNYDRSINGGMPLLTDIQVREIRNRYEAYSDKNSGTALAKEFGVNYSTLMNIVYKRRRRHA